MGLDTSVRTGLTKKAFPGMRTGTNSPDKVTGVSEEATVSIPFGACVQQGTGDDGCLMPTATNNTLKGIVMHAHRYNVGSGSALQELDATGLKPGTVFDVAVEGELDVLLEENVTPTSAVRVRVSGTGTIGAFRATADAGHTIDVSKFCTWMETATAASGVGRLRFDFTDRKNASAD